MPSASPYMGGGAIIINNSQITAASGSIIHFVTGIPQRIDLQNNHYLLNTTNPIMTSDAGFNIATYIGALNANDRIYIHVTNNETFNSTQDRTYAALTLIPATLLFTDSTKVIVQLGERTQTGVAADPLNSGSTGNYFKRFQAANGTTLDLGIMASSPYGTWLQSYLTSNMSTYFPISLNPMGGNIGINTTFSPRWMNTPGFDGSFSSTTITPSRLLR